MSWDQFGLTDVRVGCESSEREFGLHGCESSELLAYGCESWRVRVGNERADGLTDVRVGV